MKSVLRRRYLGLVLLVLPLDLAAQGMKGDSAAITLAKRLIERMGGTALWSKANWLYARERASYANRDSVADVQFWRRTDAPAQWARFSEPDRESAWTATSGWERNGSQITHYDRARLQQRVGWWAGEIYIMYVRFARDDQNLRLVSTGPLSLTVIDDTDGENLGEFHFGRSGELLRWSKRFGTSAVEYVYGPLKSFGPIRVPDWGTLSDGSFRFYYTDFRLSEIAPNVSFTPPSP